MRLEVTDHVILSIQHSRQRSHIVLLGLVVRMDQSPALVRMSIIPPIQGIPFPVLSVMLLFMVMSISRTVRYQRPMVSEEFRRGRAMVSRVLSAVVGSRVIVRHIGHQSLISLDLLVDRIVLYHSELLFGSTSIHSALLRSYL